MQPGAAVDSPGAGLDRRLRDVASGLLLVATGVIWLLPEYQLPEAAWLWAVAGVLLGVNAVRYLKGIKVNALSTMAGVAAAIAALTQIWQDFPFVAIGLIVMGVSLLAKPLLTRHA